MEPNQSDANVNAKEAPRVAMSRPQTAAPAIEIFDDNKSDDGASTVFYNDSEQDKENHQPDSSAASMEAPSSKPIVISNIGKKSLINDECCNATRSISSQEINDAAACSSSGCTSGKNFVNKRPKTSVLSRMSQHKDMDYKKRPHSSYISKNINQVSGGGAPVSSATETTRSAKEAASKVVYNTNKVMITDENQELGVFGRKYAHKVKKEAPPCCTLKEGYWKYDLLNRG